MELTINGELYENLAEILTVSDLLAYLKLPKGKIAVERNLEIVSKSAFDTTQLETNDKLEIIHFIGGG
ncbi:MAG: thiamine biosynthesis protein ThiS [Robiginitomaculum sp.]|nr:MAG: thiamine biosynthesis protein ThiS [Robiginitomaculum sp.]